MTRTDKPVVRDSKSSLWTAVRDGLVSSSDLTPSGKLRPSLTPTPIETCILPLPPFKRQQKPFDKQGFVVKSSIRPVLANMDTNVLVLCREVQRDDRQLSDIRDALTTIERGVRELKLALERP